MTAAAIVVAAGRGERFGAAGNKLLLPLAGRPVLLWTLLRLRACPRLTEFVIVAAERDREAVVTLAEQALPDRPWRMAAGGATRSQSVRSGLAALPAEVEWVAIHDGARPLISPALVERLLDAAGLTSEQWQTTPILVVLPSLNFIAAALLAELHGRMGNFPPIVRIRPVAESLPRRYEVAEILDLQAIRDAARRKR